MYLESSPSVSWFTAEAHLIRQPTKRSYHKNLTELIYRSSTNKQDEVSSKSGSRQKPFDPPTDNQLDPNDENTMKYFLFSEFSSLDFFFFFGNKTKQVFNEFINGSDAMRHLKLSNIKAIVTDTTAIVSALHHALPKRTSSSASSASPKVGGGGNPSTLRSATGGNGSQVGR